MSTNQQTKKIIVKKNQYYVIERYEGGRIYVMGGKVWCSDDGFDTEFGNSEEILRQHNIEIVDE
jgi:hypothetical protein